MMKQLSKQNGISLVEVLAIIVIVSIVSSLIYNIMFSGMNFSEKESRKATLQQQSNYVLVVWREYHENGAPYKITVSNDAKTVKFEQYSSASFDAVTRTDVISDSRFSYELFASSEDDTIHKITQNTFIPTVDKNLKLEIVILNEGKGTSSYKLETVLSRL